MAGQAEFFDLDERYRVLSAAGDPLERLAAVVDLSCLNGSSSVRLLRSDSPPTNPKPLHY